MTLIEKIEALNDPYSNPEREAAIRDVLEIIRQHEQTQKHETPESD